MASATATYHHGNLREALVDAGLELARTGGPGAVVLRAVNRAASVSHSAAYRHFADRDALLEAVAGRCMARFALLTEQRLAAVPRRRDPARRALDRFEACGRAYLEFAQTEPGWFRTAFGVPCDLDDFPVDQGRGESGLNPYELLGACLDDLVDAGLLDPADRPGAEIAPWSMVHGLAMLLVDGPLRNLDAAGRAAATDLLMDLARRAYDGPTTSGE